MAQTINLHNLLPKRSLMTLDSAFVASTTFLMLAMMSIAYVFSVWQNSRLTEEKQLLVKRENSLAEQVVTLAAMYPESQYPNNSSDPKVVLTSELDGLVKNNNLGFSEYFVFMAKHAREDVWLAKITVAQGGAGVRLEGHAKSPLAVSQYINQLKRESAFSNIDFDVLKISRAKGRDGLKQVGFVASTVSMG